MSARGKDARRLLWLIWAPCARPVCKKNLNILLALLFDSSLLSSTWTRSSLSDVLFVFIVASVPQSCQSFCQNTAGFFFFFAVFTWSTFMCCTAPLLLCLLILASCPRAIPRLLQSISKSRWPTCARHRSVCPLSSSSPLTCSSSTSVTLFVLPAKFKVVDVFETRYLKPKSFCLCVFVCVCALLHRPAGKSASSKAWTAWVQSLKCLWLAW